MAYLNVQERRIQTKIAYVGPELAGKATNLRQLHDDSSRGQATNAQLTGDLLSLDWRPLSPSARFQDCDVAVKVVAPKGTISTESLEEVLDGVDGVVVVVDAAPSAQDENRRAFELVRDAVARRGARGATTSVVVQLNKSDLADALPATDIPNAFDWPVVPASAVKGEGVHETLEVALSNVMEAFNKKPPVSSEEPSSNPLLDALREVLRETVAEHVAALEERFTVRLSQAIATQARKSEAALTELRETLVAKAEETTRAVAACRTKLEDVSERIAVVQSLDVTLNSLVTSIELSAALSELPKVTDIAAAMKDLATGQELVDLEMRLREDAVSRAKLERDHLKRVVDPVASGVSSVKKDLTDLNAKTDAVMTTTAPVAPALKAVPTRLDQLEAVVQRELRGVLGSHLKKVDESVQEMHTATSESLTRTETKAAEIHAGLTELLDELKKRKKGWFS